MSNNAIDYQRTYMTTFTNRGNILRANEWLKPGDYLLSSLGSFFAIMQSDGNFCIYRGHNPATDQREWIWGVQKLEPSSFAIMQSDGNFCVYYGLEPGKPGNRHVFSIEQMAKIKIPIDHRIPHNPQLQAPATMQVYAIMEDTGNFAVYLETKVSGNPSTKTLIWETNTKRDEVKPLTFAFMNDIHFTKDEPSHYQVAKEVLATLSKLARYKWPIECGGDNINIDAVFVNGDLTNWGGQGDTASEVDELFIRDSHKPNATKFATYIGLGNHDEDPDGEWYQPDDAYRNRMWNTIAKFHATQKLENGTILPNETRYAILPVTSIEAPDTINDGGYCKWKSHSYNYVVEYISVAVFQLHRYGGDTWYGRAGGLNWLKNQLNRIGTSKPIIIHQHYGWDVFSTGAEGHPARQQMWTEQEWKPLLDILAGYNVIGFFHGHIHYPIPYHYRYTYGRGKSVPYDIFSPGSVTPDPKNNWPGGYFGLCRVGLDGRVDVLFLKTTDLDHQRENSSLTLSDSRQLFVKGGGILG